MSSVVVNRNLHRLHEALQVSPAALHDVVVVTDVVYREQEKKLFASEGSAGGQKWAPLSAEYKARKDRLFAGAKATVKGIAKARGARLKGFALRAALGSENKTLQLTGDMQRAFATQGAGHVADGFILSTGAQVRWGARGRGDFALHATGAGKLPKRDPQQRTDEQDDELRQGVRHALIPHAMKALRDMIRTGAPRPGGISA